MSTRMPCKCCLWNSTGVSITSSQFPIIVRFSQSSVLAALVSCSLVSCGEKPAVPPAAAPPSAEMQPPPAPTVVLPQTGEITTGVLTPSSPATRILSEEEKSEAVNVLLNQVKDAQAAALREARLIVNAAWPYSGYSTLAPDPASAIPARLVAIDVTVSGHTAALDADDIEIIDGITSISYGYPQVTVINGPGEIVTDPQLVPVAPAPLRLLLIYAFPKNTQTFSLNYWGQKLLATPRGFDSADSGWSLPVPGIKP